MLDGKIALFYLGELFTYHVEERNLEGFVAYNDGSKQYSNLEIRVQPLKTTTAKNRKA